MDGVSRRGLLSAAATGLAAVTNGGRSRRGAMRPDDSAARSEPTSGRGSMSPGFSPEEHAFGFRNWSAGAGQPSFDPPHDHERVSEAEAAAVVERWRAEVEEFDVSDETAAAVATDVYHSLNRDTGMNGHCFGMIYAAQQYHRKPGSIPVSVDRASEIPKPTGAYSPVGDDIDRYHNEQFLDFDSWWTARALQLPRELAPIDYETQLARIEAAVDARGTIGVGLGDSFRDGGHVVLAYDYQQTAYGTRVDVYDPNYRANEYPSDNATGTVRFETAGQRVRATAAASGEYGRFLTLPRTREVDTSRFLAEGLRADLGTTLALLFRRVMHFEVQSPVPLSVECPDGVTLVHDPARSGPGTTGRHVRYGAPAGEYEVRLAGGAGGDYALRVRGVSQDGTFLNQEYSGCCVPGEIHVFRAEAPGALEADGSLEPSTEAATAASRSHSG